MSCSARTPSSKVSALIVGGGLCGEPSPLREHPEDADQRRGRRRQSRPHARPRAPPPARPAPVRRRGSLQSRLPRPRSGRRWPECRRSAAAQFRRQPGTRRWHSRWPSATSPPLPQPGQEGTVSPERVRRGGGCSARKVGPLPASQPTPLACRLPHLPRAGGRVRFLVSGAGKPQS